MASSNFLSTLEFFFSDDEDQTSPETTKMNFKDALNENWFTKNLLWSIVPFCSNPETSPDISNSECMSISDWRALGWESEDGVVLMLLAKSATGLEKNFELPGVRTAFSSEVKPKDNGPVDLLSEKVKILSICHF